MSWGMPPGAWDSHMHVINPTTWLLARDARYVPTPRLLSDALTFESTLGIKNIILVQPSIYGNDNSCLLDALIDVNEFGGYRGRGVVTFDPFTVTEQQLRKWRELGVRGVRLNLKSVGASMEQAGFESILLKYAEVVRPLGWVLQLYVSMEMVPWLERIAPQLGVKLCLDHFASPTLPTLWSSNFNPYDLPGFGSLISLLHQGSTYVKLSGAYRLSADPEFRTLQPVAEELLRVAGNYRLVFASDWPHTRFENVDVRPFVWKLLEWCKGDKVLIERIFRDNAEDLWGLTPKPRQ